MDRYNTEGGGYRGFMGVFDRQMDEKIAAREREAQAAPKPEVLASTPDHNTTVTTETREVVKASATEQPINVRKSIQEFTNSFSEIEEGSYERAEAAARGLKNAVARADSFSAIPEMLEIALKQMQAFIEIEGGIWNGRAGHTYGFFVQTLAEAGEKVLMAECARLGNENYPVCLESCRYGLTLMHAADKLFEKVPTMCEEPEYFGSMYRIPQSPYVKGNVVRSLISAWIQFLALDHVESYLSEDYSNKIRSEYKREVTSKRRVGETLCPEKLAQANRIGKIDLENLLKDTFDFSGSESLQKLLSAIC